MQQQQPLVAGSLLLLSLCIVHSEAGNEPSMVKYKIQKGFCLTGAKTEKDGDILQATSPSECAVECTIKSCIRGSFDSELKVCRILYSLDSYVQIAKEACKNFIASFIEKFQLLILWKLDLHAKGANLGIGGSSFSVLNENGGVSYAKNHAVFSGDASTNLTAVGLKSVAIVDFTLSWWMIPDNIGPGISSKCIMETWSPDQPYSTRVAFNVWQKHPRLIDVNALDDATGADWGTYSADELPVNQWTFVTYVHNTATGQGSLYFNATEISYTSRNTITGAAKTTRRIGDHLQIGTASPRQEDSGIYNFLGRLKCVSMATRVLAAVEIAELMQDCN